MTDDIGYEALTDAALRGVVREALKKFADASRPPGDHHFYITFRTKAPGVEIADYLRERFPDEMTIVIQYQYWDLEIHKDRFEVVLKFSGVPQHLDIPFSALTRFADPSVNFGLSFEKGEDSEGAGDDFTEDFDDDDLDSSASDNKPSDGQTGSTVVSLEAFRKK